MPLIRALDSGISGLENFQTAIDVIGNNISNVNTTGYKTSTINFQDAISQLVHGASPGGTTVGGTNPLEVGLGANLGSVTQLFTQGQLQLTGNPTDLAVNGNGFFILNTPNGTAYTRDGNFTLDANENLVDANGNFVQGFTATNGVVNKGTVGNINIPLGTLSIAKATTTETFGGNFNANAPVAPAPGSSFNVTTQVYDSLGNAHTWTITFNNLGPGFAPPGDSSQWSYSIAPDAGTTITANQTGVVDFTNTGTVDTTNSTGGGAPKVTVGTFADNAKTPQNVTFSFTGFTQLGGQTSATVTNQDGVALGALNNFSIGQDGTITGSFTNGLQQILGQVALANFSNPQGLEKLGNSLFQQSSNSGTPQVNAPQTGGLGAVIGGALESSNVDLSKEFTNLIVSQRAFEANARIITTSDTVLGDLIQAIGGV